MKLILPTPEEAALLLLKILEEAEQASVKTFTRARFSRATLKRVFGRSLIADDFLSDVGQWLHAAGWTLFYSGEVFGAVRSDALKNWPRVSDSCLKKHRAEIFDGTFNFESLREGMRARFNERFDDSETE